MLEKQTNEVQFQQQDSGHDAHYLDNGERFEPRGTFAFLMLMLVGFAIYWGYMWYVAVILRGVTG